MSDVHQLLLETLPAAIEAGKFGTNNVKFLNFVEDKNYVGQEHFASDVFFGSVVMATKYNDKVSQSVVIKVTTNSRPYKRKTLACQFYNEIFFYNDVVPFLSKYDSENIIQKYFPKFFYGVATLGEDPSKDIMVFENLQTRGFKLTSSRTFIDFAHIKLSIVGIARFHALSLVAKAEDPEGFHRIVSEIREADWTEEISKFESNSGFLSKNCARGIRPLQDNPKYNTKLSGLWKIVENVDTVMRNILLPLQPFAVICHGDFCRNNQFYSYNGAGEPTDVKFFDLGAIRYNSPAIDLAFFLFLNASPEIRCSKWDEIIEIYAYEMRSTLNPVNVVTPSPTDIKQEFQQRGVHGYVKCSFYLPMMLAGASGKDQVNIDNIVEFSVQRGGEKATDLVSAIVKHMIDQKFDFDSV